MINHQWRIQSSYRNHGKSVVWLNESEYKQWKRVHIIVCVSIKKSNWSMYFFFSDWVRVRNYCLKHKTLLYYQTIVRNPIYLIHLLLEDDNNAPSTRRKKCMLAFSFMLKKFSDSITICITLIPFTCIYFVNLIVFSISNFFVVF